MSDRAGMGEVDQVQAAIALGRLAELMRDQGVSIELGRDFVRFQSIVDCIADKTLTEIFDQRFNTDTPKTAFWLVLRDTTKTVVGIQAVRFTDLGSMTLADFLDRYWARVFGATSTGPATLSHDQPRHLSSITGRIAYAGDAWIDQGHRRQGLAMVFAKVAMIAALLQEDWSIDHFYLFTHAKTAEAGMISKMGVPRHYPFAVRWQERASQLPPDLWLGHASRRDLLDLIDATADAPRLAPTGLPRFQAGGGQAEQ